MKAQGGDLPRIPWVQPSHPEGGTKTKKNKDHQPTNSPHSKKNTFLGHSAGDLFGKVKSQHQHGSFHMTYGENVTLLKVANVTADDPE